MTVWRCGLLLSALALVSLAGPSFAETLKPKPTHHAAHAGVKVAPPSSDDIFVGAGADPGSDNHYFSDTRQPANSSLGPPIFSRWQ